LELPVLDQTDWCTLHEIQSIYNKNTIDLLNGRNNPNHIRNYRGNRNQLAAILRRGLKG